MGILQKIINAIIGPEPTIDPVEASRELIRRAGYSEAICANALARFDRRMALRQDIGGSLNAVMAWAESQERQS